MSETIANLAQKNSRNALSRIEGLEQRLQELQKAFTDLLRSLDKSFGSVQSDLASVNEVLNATTEVVGPTAIQEVILRVRKENALAQEQSAKNDIAERVAKGALVPKDTVGEKALVVFNETKEDGTPLVVGGRAQFFLFELKPAFKEQVLGKKVGDFVVSDGPDKHKFTLTEIYENVAQE